MTKQRKETGESLLFTITNYGLWFILGNLYFVLLNLPLVFVLVMVYSNGAKPILADIGPILFLCCIPIGPAFTALLSVMGKLVREKDVRLTRDFFKAYKVSCPQSLFFWIIELCVMFFLFFDASFFKIHWNVPAEVFYILMVFIFLISLYVYPIISRFYLKAGDVLRLSIKYTLTKPHVSLINLICLISLGFVMYKITLIILLFLVSLICYIIMWNMQHILKEIDTDLKAQQ